MIGVSNGQADLEYCRRLAREAKTTAQYVEDHGVNFIRHEEKNVSDLTPSELCYPALLIINIFF